MMQTTNLDLVKLTAVLLLTAICGRNAHAQLKNVGRQVAANKQVSIDRIDHGAFNSLLGKYVNEDGEVNYSKWKSSASDRIRLQNYLNHLSTANPEMQAQREAKLAFWINAYNAVTLEGILEVYPTSSIRNHTKKLGYDIWRDLKLAVGNRQINLNDIEHQILRKMDEPRIHFAIVCASVGCPRLLNEAFVANKLESQLTANSNDFFSRRRNLDYDSAKQQLRLSAILKWFGSDFGDDRASQIRAIAPYFPVEFQKVVQRGGYSVSFQEYDWNLNTQ